MAVAASGPIQYVAAAPAGAPPAAPVAVPPAAKAAQPVQAAADKDQLMTEEEKEAQKQAQEFHSHPEKMSFEQLLNIDNL